MHDTNTRNKKNGYKKLKGFSHHVWQPKARLLYFALNQQKDYALNMKKNMWYIVFLLKINATHLFSNFFLTRMNRENT
jgi:hypothetical protein